MDKEDIDLIRVSGDTWTPDRTSPYMNAVEYFNYTNRDITIVDDLGCETEVLRRNDSAMDFGFEDRGYIVIKVTRLIDPRRVKVSDNRAKHFVDQEYLDKLREEIERHKSAFTEGVPESNQWKHMVQFTIHLKPEGNVINYKSDLLGVVIKESEDYSTRTFEATPEGYIKNVMVPDLAELDAKDDGGEDKGVRTICSARLVDNDRRVGTLWTNMFGTATKVEPVKDERQKEGLYLAGGHHLEIKLFISIEELLEPKVLMKYGLFQTELECKKNSTGDYTTTVITERDKTKKENRSLRDENTKLSNKVAAMEMDAKAEKINKAHSEYKHTRSYDSMKDYYDNNILASVNRVVDKALMFIKSGISLLTAYKLVKAFI